MNFINIGVIGCGEQGYRNVCAIKKHENFKVSFILEPNRKSLISKYNVLKDISSISKIEDINKFNIDYLFINTPHFTHYELIKKGLENGLNIIVEKPLSINYEESLELTLLAESKKLNLITWFGKRYSNNINICKKLIDNKEIGDIQHVNINLLANKDEKYWNGGFSGKGTSWRSQWDKSGGGVLIMSGIHYIDLLIYLINGKIDSCYASMSTITNNIEVEDNIAGFIKLNETTVNFCFSTTTQGLTSEYLDILIIGKYGTIRVGNDIKYYTSKNKKWVNVTPNKQDLQMVFLDELYEFHENNNVSNMSCKDGMETQKFIDAIYKSAKENELIKF